MKDAMVLWQRGFFGKGDLSRSEPSWLARQINARKLAKKGEIPHALFYSPKSKKEKKKAVWLSMRACVWL